MTYRNWKKDRKRRFSVSQTTTKSINQFSWWGNHKWKLPSRIVKSSHSTFDDGEFNQQIRRFDVEFQFRITVVKNMIASLKINDWIGAWMEWNEWKRKTNLEWRTLRPINSLHRGMCDLHKVTRAHRRTVSR
jgi:hypothetical protein